MPWSGSSPNQTFTRTDGTRTGSTTWQEADGAGVDIIAVDHDTHDQDLASGINAALKKDGGNQPSANLPMGSYRHTNVGDAQALTQYISAGQAFSNVGHYISTVGGTANAIALTTGFSLTAYAAGQEFSFKVASANTSTVTVNVDSLGAKAIVSADGDALQAGDLPANSLPTIQYDGTQFRLKARPVSIGGSGDILARITPVGAIIPWPGTTAPAGWLLCYGQAVSRSTYAELYAAIGTTYGTGDGSTTFNLPDYRGRVPFGKDNMGGSAAGRLTSTYGPDGTTLGSVGGAQSVTLTSGQIPSHNHSASVSDPGHSHQQTVTADGGLTGSTTGGGFSAYAFDGAQSTGASVTGISVTIGNTGGGGAHANVPPAIVQNYIILALPATASAATVGVNGLLYKWSTVTSDTDPGAGYLGLNNATISSATTLYISETDVVGASMGPAIALWDDSTSTTKGTLYIYKVGQLSTYAVFTVSGSITDAGTYDKVTLSHVTSGGSFSSGDQLAVLYVPNGDKGDTGAPGSAGPTGPNTGLDYAWASATSGDPGSGNVLYNNSTPASVTQINISKTGRNGESLGAVIATWDDSTNTAHYGHLRVLAVTDRTKFIEAEVTGLSDQTTYYAVTVSTTASGTLPSAGDVIAVVFERTGNKGVDGTGTGDVTGQAASVDGEIALFSLTTGKVIKRATTTGLLKASSGVLAQAVADTDYTANSFKTIAVSGQSDVVADSAADTLTLAAGSGITITTDASTDTVTFAASGGAGSPSEPQGRLTLTSGTPVLTSTVSGATTIYYALHAGRYVPIYNGTSWTMTDIGGELSQATSDATKSPAACTTNSNYDLFVWDDSGTYRCTRGPAWSSDTSRGTGAGTTELERVAGIYVNKVAITNGPAAQRGTYVGTVRTNGSSTVDFSLGSTASGGGEAKINVWNAYNRVAVRVSVADSTANWSYASTTWRSSNNSATNRISFVHGLTAEPVSALFSQVITSTSGAPKTGINLDSTSATPGPFQGYVNSGAVNIQAVAIYGGYPGLGSHYLQAMEAGNTTVSFYGNGSHLLTGELFA